MSFSVTIPQLFYDLIARVLPGFLFIILIRVAFAWSGLQILALFDSNSENFVKTIGSGIGYLIISYFLGWTFRAFTFWSFEAGVRNGYGPKKQEGEEPLSLSGMYQQIRLKHAAAGFRIVKLRAEARMLETTRTAMAVVVLIVVLHFLYSVAAHDPFDPAARSTEIAAGIIAAFLLLALLISEKRAWDQYYGNIPAIYELVKSIPIGKRERPKTGRGEPSNSLQRA